MKKFAAILLALVLVLALSAPAFAAQQDVSDGTGSTTVSFQLDNTQISATVPLNFTVVVKGDGTIVWPTSTATQITNTSVYAIKVTTITTVAKNSWPLADSAGDTEALVATVNGVALNGEKTVSTTAWNIAKGEALDLTFAGSIAHPGDKTAALSTDATEVFTVTFTVASGSHTTTP